VSFLIVCSRWLQAIHCRELEAREPAKHDPPNKIKFSSGAKEHLTNLGLAKGSAERKAVKDYHRNIIHAEMAKNGATSAQILKLGNFEHSAEPFN
jgi:hypothetical protein